MLAEHLRHRRAGVPAGRRAGAAARRPGRSRSANRCRCPARPRPSRVLSGGAVLAKPPVRKLAKDLGVDLSTITGSGPGGVITRDDVQCCAAAEHGGRRRPRSVGSAEPGPPSSGRSEATADPDQGRPQGHGAGDGAVGVHRAARERVADLRRVRHHGTARAAADPARVRRRQDLAAVDHRQGGLPGAAAYPGAELELGRGGSGDRDQVRDQPRHRRGDAARAGGAEHQGRRPAQPGRPGHRRSTRLVATAREGRTQPADMSRRDVHDHQHRGVRGRRRHADPQPGRGRDPLRRPDRPPALGGRHRQPTSGSSRAG